MFPLATPPFRLGARTLFLVCLALVLSRGIHGQEVTPLNLGGLGAPSFESFTPRDGLPDGVITTIGVDAEGFTWAASPRGLYRFTGHRWKREADVEDAGRNHRRMLLDDAGTLWLASIDAGMGRHRNGRWEFLRRADGLPADHNYRVSQFTDSSGKRRTWLLTIDAGLYELVGGHWVADPGNSTLPLNPLLSMTSTTQLFGEARQWLGTGEHGLFFRREGAAAWQRFTIEGQYAVQVEDVQRSLDSSGESLWISVFGSGVYRVDEKQTKRWCSENGALRSNQVYSLTMAMNSDGITVWVASRGGLVRIRGDATEIYDRRHGLPSDQVRGTFLWRSPDGEDVLWIATESGVARAVFTDDRWRTASLMGAGSVGVFGVLVEPDGKNGERLWVASSRDGLGLFERGKWRTFSTHTGELPGDNLRVIKRTLDVDGRPVLWTSVEGGHLVQIDDDLHVRPIATPWPIEVGQDVMDILSRDLQGKREVWFATKHGIFRRRQDSWTAVPGRDGDTGLRATQLCEQVSRNGEHTLWASTSQGLARLDGESWTLVRGVRGLPSGNMIGLSLVRTKGREVLWIGTGTEGVIRLDVSNPRAPVVLPASELPAPIDTTVYSALHDSKGRAYLCTNDGVQQLTPDGKGGWIERVFRRRDGLVHEECNTNAQFMDSHDRFWTGTLGGLTVFDPGPPETGFRKSLRLVGATLDGRRSDRPSLVLSPDSKELQVEFTLQTWQREDETRYRTQLVGFDSVPRAWSTEPVRTLTGIPPGDYVLRVEARDYAGVEAKPLELPVTVQPSWWQRRPVQTGFVLGGFLLVAGAASMRTRSLRTQKERLEKEVRIRTEELNEANERFRELSYTDALTVLPNRRRLLDAMHSLIESDQTGKSSLIFIDVDHFKEFNDRFGHPAGDVALGAVALCLRSCAPAPALVARYGGEEFACLLAGVPLEEARVMAERMLAEVEAFSIDVPGGETGHLTISAGVAEVRISSDADIHRLIREADNALYRAKNEGRNCVRVQSQRAS